MLKSHAKLVALALVAAALGWQPVDANAAQRSDVPRPAEARPVSAGEVDLEELFWLCDYAATSGMVGTDERVACGAVTDRLKADRFGGDFERMLQWWQANRAGRHQRIERDEDAAAPK
jgi:hypothetical protein